LLSVEIWNRATIKSLLVPGAVLFAAATLLLRSGLLPIAPSAVTFYYYAVFGGGLLLAARFHSSRIFFALLVLFLGQRAIEFFAAPGVSAGPGRIALEAVSFLLPVNFALFTFIRERGLAISAIASRLGLIFVESVFVAVICRPDEVGAPFFLHPAIFSPHLFQWTRIPQFSWILFLIASLLLLVRFLLYRKPVESGLLWSLVTVFLGLQSGAIGAVPRAYVASAGLVLLSSIIENSYVLAYHDELTALPGRRAFNDALLRLENPYTVAVVDIDHFKNFNDTYGHDIGDQVLCMVAERLAHVTGGGEAYRVGGEEFNILFPGKTTSETLDHLELLRSRIESSVFRVRRPQDRRSQAHGPDRRRVPQKKILRGQSSQQKLFGEELRVTVSIGVAESAALTRDADQVIRAADQALYRAKDSGRNRVEAAHAPRARAAKRSA
jgi:diguanylate cyclase (GGDEF)-like protein